MSMNSETTSACSRFFSIAELVALFLHQADATVLINCQRVCQEWNSIIKSSEALQENLFFVPVQQDESDSSQTVTLNPLLDKCFGRILGAQDKFLSPSTGKEALRTEPCTYHDLSALPWARDGKDDDAPSRLAFSREQASWRRMLVSQPPIHHFDWWHEWECAARPSDEPFSGLSKRGGESRRYLSGTMTIGTLWDMIEPLLLRECRVRTVFYLLGGSAAEDAFAARWNAAGEADLRSSVRVQDISIIIPRISLHSQQVWPSEVGMTYARFDVATKSWHISGELPAGPLTERQRRQYEGAKGSGFAWLNIDRRRDSEAENARWSRSGAFALPSPQPGISSSSCGR